MKTFFGYKGQLVSMDAKMLGRVMKTETNESIAEYLRAQLVIGQRTGDKVLINIGKLCPEFKTDFNVKDVFEPELTFNRAEWLKEENYIKFVKEEENHSIGGLNPGMYRLMDETFSLTIGSEAGTEEEIVKILAALPHSDSFKKVIVE